MCLDWAHLKKQKQKKDTNVYLNHKKSNSQEANSENVLIFHFLKKLWVEAGNIA